MRLRGSTRVFLPSPFLYLLLLVVVFVFSPFRLGPAKFLYEDVAALSIAPSVDSRTLRLAELHRGCHRHTLWQVFLNSLVVVMTTLLGSVLTCSLAGFSFSRLRWRGRDTIFVALLTSLMMPYAVTLIPTFVLWKYLRGITPLCHWSCRPGLAQE